MNNPVANESNNSNESNDNIELNLNLDENELYYYLLKSIYNTIETNSSNTFNNSGIKITKPDVVFDVTKKTIWKNFFKICKDIGRDSDDDKQLIVKFYKKEFSNSPSVNKDGQFLIRGRYSVQMISDVLKNFIRIFVKCEPCKGINTTVIKKDNRLTYLVCQNNGCKYEKVITYSL